MLTEPSFKNEMEKFAVSPATANSEIANSVILPTETLNCLFETAIFPLGPKTIISRKYVPGIVIPEKLSVAEFAVSAGIVIEFWTVSISVPTESVILPCT